MADEQNPRSGSVCPARTGSHSGAAEARSGGQRLKPPPEMAATPWEGDLPNRIRERFGDQVSAVHVLDKEFRGHQTGRDRSADRISETGRFDYLVDLTAADYPKRAERFSILILYSFARNMSACESRPRLPMAQNPAPSSASM
jgi:hypothetical protein